MNKYGSRWNERSNSFEYPFRPYEPTSPQFPDVSFKAKSLAHAARLIDGLNEEMMGKSREEVDADQVLVNLLRGVRFSGYQK